MADPAHRSATYDDLLALPAPLVGEIVFGVLHANPRPAPKHARASSTLGEEIGPPFNRGKGGPGGWVILDEPEIHLGPHVLVPDLAGWRRARMPTLPVDEAYFGLAPDWACEVLSPRTARLDRGDKRKVYQEYQVGHVWLIDPDALTLEVFALDGGSYRLVEVFSGEEGVRAPPFDAVAIDLGALWSR